MVKALTAADLATLLDHARSRIGIPDVTDRAVWNRVDPDVRGRLLAAAEAELATPPPVLSATAWARAFRDGVRTEYEDAARRLRDRVGVSVLGVVLTGEVEPFLDVAIDGMVALAEASTWCWAPHDGFTAARGRSRARCRRPLPGPRRGRGDFAVGLGRSRARTAVGRQGAGAASRDYGAKSTNACSILSNEFGTGTGSACRRRRAQLESVDPRRRPDRRDPAVRRPRAAAAIWSGWS